MAKDNSQSKASATAPVAAPTPVKTQLIVVGRIGNEEITMPDMSPRAAAAKAAVAQYEGYKNVITNEEEKVWLSGELAKVKQQQHAVTVELEKITKPLLESRRQSLAASKAAENLVAPLLQYLVIGERILKDEILRYEDVVETKRLQAEAELQRLAQEEQRRLEDVARQEAEDAARKNEEELRLAQELADAGNQKAATEARAQAEANLERAAESVQQTFEEAERVTNTAVVTSSSVKVAGQSIIGKWVADVVDVMEVLRGISGPHVQISSVPHTPVTPLEVVRVKHQGKLVPLPVFKGKLAEIDSIEINLAWFNDRARKEEENFNYRGMKTRFVKDLRVRP